MKLIELINRLEGVLANYGERGAELEITLCVESENHQFEARLADVAVETGKYGEPKRVILCDPNI